MAACRGAPKAAHGTARGGWWLKGPMSLRLLIAIKEQLKGP